MDFVVGGVAAMVAACITNPLDLIKIRMQLQGELEARGQHPIHYRNSLHAAYQIYKHEGILSLQNGLVPALWVQFILNGSRLGGFQFAENHNLVRDENGKLIFHRAVLVGGICGVVGHYCANPFFLVKTYKQSISTNAIAVGHQHKAMRLFPKLKHIVLTHGFKGLYKGGVATFPRAFVASSSQLMGFIYAKDWLLSRNYFQDKPLLTSFCSSLVAGVAISVLTTPFDLILTRLYNQGVTPDGKGLLYSGYFDCVYKVYKLEGLRAFYKGIGPMYMRLGPHSMLTLVLWDVFKDLFEKYGPRTASPK